VPDTYDIAASWAALAGTVGQTRPNVIVGGAIAALAAGNWRVHVQPTSIFASDLDARKIGLISPDSGAVIPITVHGAVDGAGGGASTYQGNSAAVANLRNTGTVEDLAVVATDAVGTISIHRTFTTLDPDLATTSPINNAVNNGGALADGATFLITVPAATGAAGNSGVLTNSVISQILLVDVDGDGFKDLVVGCPNSNGVVPAPALAFTAGTGTGRVFIWLNQRQTNFGTSPFTAAPQFAYGLNAAPAAAAGVPDLASPEAFGYAIAHDSVNNLLIISDPSAITDGDGTGAGVATDDAGVVVAVGALPKGPNDSINGGTAATDTSSTWIMHSASAGGAIPLATAEDLLGTSLAVGTIGGSRGVMVGAPGYGAVLTGAAFFVRFSGTAGNINETTAFRAYLPAAGTATNYGRRVARGDFDKNGTDDFVVSMSGTAAAGAGGFQILFNSAANLAATAQIATFAGTGADNAGTTLSVFDRNGDGFDDLAVMAPGRVVASGAAAGFLGAILFFDGKTTGLPGSTLSAVDTIRNAALTAPADSGFCETTAEVFADYLNADYFIAADVNGDNTADQLWSAGGVGFDAVGVMTSEVGAVPTP